jgi:hypothetical protein
VGQERASTLLSHLHEAVILRLRAWLLAARHSDHIHIWAATLSARESRSMLLAAALAKCVPNVTNRQMASRNVARNGHGTASVSIYIRHV